MTTQPQPTAKELDKFYTKPEVVSALLTPFIPLLKEADYIIEPSAGSGFILDFCLEHNPLSFGFDLLPEADHIVQQDFLEFNPDEHNVPKTGLRIAVANPPFGKRSKLAIEFFNKLTEFTDIILIIIPVSWNRYSIQNKLTKDWELKHSERLPEKSFLLNGKPYNVNCCFQVWTRPKKDQLDNGITW